MLVACLPGWALANLDFSNARVSHLDNGMTLIVLEEHTLPVVSVQMLYRVGARNETAGATGLAHFLEHMAFRDSENFPDTGLVSAIYAVGGEWHGYTWLDQTTYYATAPREQLDLLLRIEADRMARLQISEEDVIVERGAVLTEMHSYENDPMSVLHDNAMYLTFLAHPYRNNTIGWESDVAQMRHTDVVAFYKQHYHPGNAILAVVGDVRSDQVIRQVHEHFADLPGHSPTPVPHTVEPPQNGERRIRLQGELDQKHFKIVYRAPAASSPDYAAFLVLQELLGGGSGVSFLQNDWGTPVLADSPLGRIPGSLTTWFPPSAQDYAFVISGTEAPDADETRIESAVSGTIEQLRSRLERNREPVMTALEHARNRVLRELVFDVQTTEDAAHQLSFFAGLDALDALLELPKSVAGISTNDVLRVMDRYLQARQRTVAWYVPAQPSIPDFIPNIAEPEPPIPKVKTLAAKDSPVAPPAPVLTELLSPPHIARLSNDVPVVLQRSPLSPTVSLRVISPQAEFPAGTKVNPNQPVWGYSTVIEDVLPAELPAAIERAGKALEQAKPAIGPDTVDASDPEALMQQSFTDLLDLSSAKPTGSINPLLIVISGDINWEKATTALERTFGERSPAAFLTPETKPPIEAKTIETQLSTPAAQVQLGYIVQAPAPSNPQSAAWQMALYIFTHHYEGRLGEEAISNRGLIYYIGSEYHTDGTNGWITLSMGVDPKNLPALQSLLREKLKELVEQPPTQAEVDEARNHLLGRLVSAAQSNPELADKLAQQWLWYGPMADYQSNAELKDELAVYSAGLPRSMNTEALERRLEAVSREDILVLLPAFTNGSIVSIETPPP